jgi:sugar lactone lactonase YvrE
MFWPGDTGNVGPRAVIAGPATGLDGYMRGIAADTTGRIYVSDDACGCVSIFAPNLEGNVAPAAQISNSYGWSLALDGAGRLYVASYVQDGSIAIYPAGVTGSVAPVATIAGSNTGLNWPIAIAVDAAGRIYASNIDQLNQGNDRITIYAAGATGNVAPVAAIGGPNTGLGPSGPWGIAVDAAGRIYSANSGPPSITVYAAGSSGNVAPIQTIAGPNTGLTNPWSVAVDAAGRIYVPDSSGIAIFAPGATGNVRPTARIAGPNTGLRALLVAFGL